MKIFVEVDYLDIDDSLPQFLFNIFDVHVFGNDGNFHDINFFLTFWRGGDWNLPCCCIRCNG